MVCEKSHGIRLLACAEVLQEFVGGASGDFRAAMGLFYMTESRYQKEPI